MNTSDTPWDEAPDNLLTFAGRDPALTEEFIDRILCGQPVAVCAPLQELVLAELVATLRQPARPGELRGEATAVAAYQWEMKTHALKEQRPRQLGPSVSARIVAAAFVGSLGMGGIAAAAAEGSLPAPLQQLAHVFFGAPPANANGHDGDDDMGGAGPVPMPTDAWPPTPSQQESSGITNPAVPTDPAALDRCAVDFCADIVGPGPEPDNITEPGSSPTTSASASNATNSNASESAEATPPVGGQSAGPPAPSGGPPPASQSADTPPAPSGGPPPASHSADTPPAPPGEPPPADHLTRMSSSPEAQGSNEDMSLAEATSP